MIRVARINNDWFEHVRADAKLAPVVLLQILGPDMNFEEVRHVLNRGGDFVGQLICVPFLELYIPPSLVAQTALHLLNNLDKAEVFVEHCDLDLETLKKVGRGTAKAKKSDEEIAKDLLENPEFDKKVKKFCDVPAAINWSILKSCVAVVAGKDFSIPDSVILAVSKQTKKEHNSMSISMTYLSRQHFVKGLMPSILTPAYPPLSSFLALARRYLLDA